VPVVFDHSIIPSQNKKQSAEFYARIFGFESLGKQTERLYAVRVNEESILFFENSSDPDSPRGQGAHHHAFAMDAKRFKEAFARIQASGILYGDRYDQPANLKGPGKSPGARGQSSSVYFKDPVGNSLETRTYYVPLVTAARFGFPHSLVVSVSLNRSRDLTRPQETLRQGAPPSDLKVARN